MLTVALILLLLGMLPCATSLEEVPGGILSTCYLDGMSDTDSSVSYAIGRVNTTSWTKTGNSFYAVYYCQASKRNSSKPEIVALEIVTMGESPQELSLQVADIFIDKIEGTLATCLALDIGGTLEGERQELDGTYHCDGLNELIVMFSGTTTPRRQRRSVESNQTAAEVDMEQRSFYEEQSTPKKEKTPINEIVCSDGTLPEDFKAHLSEYPLGEVCTIQNDEYRKTIGRVLLINSTGGLDCLPCCVDFYWNNSTKLCEPCPHGTRQPLPSFWNTCQPVRQKKPTELPTTTSTSPEQTSTIPTTTTPSPTKTPKLNPPVDPPTGLVLTMVGQHHALIEWNETRHNMQVKHYWVEVRDFEGNVSVKHKVKGRKTWIKLNGLRAASCYEVTVSAGNPAGIGPPSHVLGVHTKPELSKLLNLHMANYTDHITFAWKPEPEDSDLTATAEIRPQAGHDETWWTFSKRHSHGQLEIPFHPFKSGNYSFQIFYATDGQNGPKSDVKSIGYEAKGCICSEHEVLEGGSNTWCILFFVLAGISIVGFGYLKKEKIEEIVAGLRGGYTAAPNQPNSN